MKTKTILAAAAIAAVTAAASAQTHTQATQAGNKLQAPMTLVTPAGTGKMIGTVTITESGKGLVFTPNLSDLPAGPHGYHVHENDSCGANEKDGKKVAAGAAGSHYDPAGSKQHLGPTGNGHLGDLPPLVVGGDGRAIVPVTAPRLKTLADVKGKALMIHAGGDNYADKPAPLGGGGERIACGVIQ
ncbi:superoxide dismutase [Cu-Zn] SodC [Massilia aerilata]|uniref:Superoxide dismutase [Cu-Zn] n=1 Tax=Massilia aerilata TaxID=453817 RepID=A0ABW0S2Z7_9BURK